jgi:HlyD family secretion protein
MLKNVDPAISTLVVGGLLMLGIGVGANALSSRGEALSTVAHADTQPSQGLAQWAASATGRVEPKGGEVRIASEAAGKIIEVLANTNDQAKEGDLLVRLDDDDYYTKIAAASAEVGVREREREEEKVSGLAADRRTAEDNVAKAQRKVFSMQEAFDASYRDQKNGKGGTTQSVEDARKKLATANDDLEKTKKSLADVLAKTDVPLPQRLEASLELARADLTAAELALQRTRVRAPFDGTVLNMLARVGETAAPSPDSALVVFGDMTSLRLRAEVEERDAAKVHVGQRVVVKADAYPDKQFEGAVTSISQSLGAPRIATRGPRRPNDVEVVEVMVALDGHPPLFTGMRVDTFFKLDKQTSEAAAATPTPPKTN